MSNGFRHKSQHVRERLKSRTYFFNESTRHRPKIKRPEFLNHSVENYLRSYNVGDFAVSDDAKRVELLIELVHVFKIDDVNNVDDLAFGEICKRLIHCRYSDDYRVRLLFFRIIHLLPLTDGRFFALIRQFSVALLRTLQLIDLPEAELVECLRAAAKLLEYLQREAGVTFRRLNAADVRLQVFVRAMLGALHALAFGASNSQRLAAAATAILVEAAVREPGHVVALLGTEWLTQCVLNAPLGAFNDERIAGALHQIFAKFLDSPILRENAELNLVLQKISAPLIDLGFFQRPLKEANDAVYGKMRNSMTTLADLMRTWSGLFACAAHRADDGRLHDASPLRIIPFLGTSDLLSENGVKLRDVIVDVCCEFICAPYSRKSFSCWAEAVTFYSEMHLPNDFSSSLRDDFVVGEMTALMASGELFDNEPDLLRCFNGVAAYALIEAGLVEALFRLIIAAPDQQMCIKATLFLSDLLNFGTTYLPRDIRCRLHAVPELMRWTAANYRQHSAFHFANGNSDDNSAADASIGASSYAPTAHKSPTKQPTSRSEFGDFVSATSSMEKLAVNGIENSYILLNRLDQLTELVQRRDRPSLLKQLPNINVFSLNGCNTSSADGEMASNAFGAKMAFDVVEAETSVQLISPLEQCLLDVSTKLFHIMTSAGGTTSSSTPPAFSTTLGVSDGSSSVFFNNIDSTFLENGFTQQQQQQQQPLPLNWRFVDQCLQTLECTSQAVMSETLQRSSKLTDRCYNFFTIVCNQFLPSRQLFAHGLPTTSSSTFDRFDMLYLVNCARRTFNFVARQIESFAGAFSPSAELAISSLGGDELSGTPTDFASPISAYNESAFYAQLIRAFALDFCAQLTDTNSHSGTFAARNLLGANTYYYFAIVRVLSEYDGSFKILERTGLFQIFLDLVLNKAKSHEYTKLILSSLNYARPGIAHVILQAGASSSEKRVRKWTTRFLNILVGLWHSSAIGRNSATTSANNVVELALRVAVAQLADESPKVVRHAVRLLVDWLPRNVKHLHLLDGVDLKLFGNAGRILEGIHVGLSSGDVSRQRIVLEFWMRDFNGQYADILEEEMRHLNLNVKRAADGQFTRASQMKTETRALRAPPHFLGALARHECGRALLLECRVIQRLAIELRAFLHAASPRDLDEDSSIVFSTDTDAAQQCCRRVKGALFALAHLARGFQREIYGSDCALLWQSLALIAELARAAAWLSVRGCAIWALNIAAAGRFAAKILSELGWEFSPKPFDPQVIHLKAFACGYGHASLASFPEGHSSLFPTRFRSADSAVRRSRQNPVKNTFLLRTNSLELITLKRYASGELSRGSASSARLDSPRSGLTTKTIDTNLSHRNEFRFITDEEQTSLISYRSILAECAVAPDKYAWDLANKAPFTIDADLCARLANKRQKSALIFPHRIAHICSRVFSDAPPLVESARRRRLCAESVRYTRANIRAAHSPLYCLHCSFVAGNLSGENRPTSVASDVAEAYRRHGAEIRRLLYRLQVCLTELDEREADARESAVNGNENYEMTAAMSSASGKSQEFTQTNATLTKLLRLYTKAPQAFRHPCLYSDVLSRTLADAFGFSQAQRRFVSHLFWDAHL